MKILGVTFSKMTLSETVQWIEQIFKRKKTYMYHIITANPEIVVDINRDPEFKKISLEADLITADGIGIIYASKINYNPISERVTGYDLLIELLKLGNEQGLSFYFFGAKEQVSLDTIQKVNQQYPNVKVVGRHNGYYTVSEEKEIIKAINMGKPDILVIALGAPLADKWLYKHKNSLNVKLGIGVGGALDVFSGNVKRAPILWRKLNLEWLYRLIMNPKRWRRQLKLPIFAYKVISERLKNRPEHD